MHTAQGSQQSRSYCNFFCELWFYSAVLLHCCTVIFSLPCCYTALLCRQQSPDSRHESGFFFLPCIHFCLLRFPAVLLLLPAAEHCPQQRTGCRTLPTSELYRIFTCSELSAVTCLLLSLQTAEASRPLAY